MKVDFIKSAMILKSGEKKIFVKELPLHKFKLQRGMYYTEMAYYCGNKTAETLGITESDEPDSRLFQGCAISPKIPIVID